MPPVFNRTGALNQAIKQRLSARNRFASANIMIEQANNEPLRDIPTEDKEEKLVESTQSEIIIAGVKITHPDKVLYEDPLITKKDVLRYYEKVSGCMV